MDRGDRSEEQKIMWFLRTLERLGLIEEWMYREVAREIWEPIHGNYN